MYKIRVFVYSLLCLVCAMANATSGESSPSAMPNWGASDVYPEEKAREIPSYIRFVNDTVEVVLADSVFYDIAGAAIFKVNRTNLNPNSPLLQELTGKVLPMANSEGWCLMGLELRGAASPEGPYYNNVRLANGRVEALRQFLVNNLDSVAQFDPHVSTVAEDFPYLLWLLERDGDGVAPILRKFMEKHNGDPARVKGEMKAVGGGKIWPRLLRDYFPKLRTARVVLYFKMPQGVDKSMRYRFTPLYEHQPPTLSYDLQASPTIRFPKFPTIQERRHLVSLSSNLLYDALYFPNYGWAPALNINAEIYPSHGNYTFRVGFTSPYYHRWSRHKFFQIRDYHLEVRRYFRPGELHTGAYLGAYVNANKYGIGLGKTKGWEGEGLGGALKVGYVVPLGSGRWRLDFHVAAGYYYTRFDPYVWGNPVTGEEDGKYYYDYTGSYTQFKQRNHRFSWLGPTELGITLSFDVLYKRKYRPGASFIRKEVVLW